MTGSRCRTRHLQTGRVEGAPQRLVVEAPSYNYEEMRRRQWRMVVRIGVSWEGGRDGVRGAYR